MSDDLVKRLRELAAGKHDDKEFALDAAERIEALEGENAAASEHIKDVERGSECLADHLEKAEARAERLEGEVAAWKTNFNNVSEAYMETCRERDRLRAALRGLHDDVDDYQRVNNLSGHNNHWMVIARKALEESQ